MEKVQDKGVLWLQKDEQDRKQETNKEIVK